MSRVTKFTPIQRVAYEFARNYSELHQVERISCVWLIETSKTDS
jgi:hypothetical protein